MSTLIRSFLQTLQGILVIIALAILLPSAAVAATLFVVASTTSPLVGEVIQFDIVLSVTDASGPGDVELTLAWGQERAIPEWVGALSLLTLPSILDPSILLSTGADCASSVGQPDGSCMLVATFGASISAGSRTIATFQMIYDWVPPAGYELCGVTPSDPACLEAGQSAGLLLEDASVFGTSPGLFPAYLTTFAVIGVRPIPEPGTAILLGLGLAIFALRRRHS